MDLDPLYARRARVVERWLEEVKVDLKVPSTEHISEPQLVDSIPQVLDEVLSLASGQSDIIAADKIGFAEKHGRDRAGHNFDPRELVREYQVLRHVIFQELEDIVSSGAVAGAATAATGRRIGEALDEALRATIGAFVTMQKSELVEMSRRDGLTGLLNHRSFYTELERELQSSNRTGLAFAVAILDLDSFKQVNDRLGHRAGDRVLVRWGERLTARLRETDILCRYGGDEFGAILPGASRITARSLFTGIAADPVTLAELGLEPPRGGDGDGAEDGTSDGGDRSRVVSDVISITCGIAEWPGDGSSAAELVETADQRLLAIKRRR